MAVARVLTWNLERRKPESGPGAAALEYLFDLDPDVMVLTEARTTMSFRGGHVLWCEPPLGSWMGSDERKVLMWSKQPWVEVDRVGVSGLDNTRFVSAATDTPFGPLRVVGVCIPWHMASVQHVEDEKRSPWELHIAYLERLAEMLRTSAERLVVAGDYNQTVPRIKYGNHAAAAAMERCMTPLIVATRGQLPGATRPGIDHIAVTRDLHAVRIWAWPGDIDGQRLSDHEGAGTDLTSAT